MARLKLEDVPQAWARYRHLSQLPDRVLPESIAKWVPDLVPFNYAFGLVPRSSGEVLTDPGRYMARATPYFCPGTLFPSW